MSQFNWIPPPKPAPWRAGKPSAIVLQAAFPASQLEQLLSSDRVAAGSDQPIPLVAYNFSDHAAHVTLKVQAPQTWKVNAPESIDLRPQSRVEVPMTLNAPFQSAKGFHAIRVEATGVDLGTAVLSFNVLPTQASTRP
jgi:uncharacterized membrane protein